MSGGDGADTFVYRNANEAGDFILYFEVGEDILDFSDLILGSGFEQENWQEYVNFEDTDTGDTIVSFDSNGDESGEGYTVTTLEGVNSLALSSACRTAACP